MYKACKMCKRIVSKNHCEYCGSKEITTLVKGIVIIYQADSEIAKAAKKEGVGKYAISAFQ